MFNNSSYTICLLNFVSIIYGSPNHLQVWRTLNLLRLNNMRNWIKLRTCCKYSFSDKGRSNNTSICYFDSCKGWLILVMYDFIFYVLYWRNTLFLDFFILLSNPKYGWSLWHIIIVKQSRFLSTRHRRRFEVFIRYAFYTSG